MPEGLHPLRRLVDELKRRKVVRTTLAYGVAAGAIMQVASVVVPALYLPDITLTIVVVVAMAGLPVAVLLSWYFDVTPDPGPDAAAGGGAAERSGASRSGTLPGATTPFIGRTTELQELVRLLDDPERRLITVTGPGGVGKTRLALHAVDVHAGTWPDGIARIALSSLASADLLPAALLESFDITPGRGADPGVEVIDFLREKQMLIVLDNFEQLTAGAALLGRIVERAPGVRLLVTSRERLNLHAETLIALDGLGVDAADGAEDSDAVRLFIACATRLDRQFAPDAAVRAEIQRICQLLGGVPLAIELAASWARVMTCTEILADLQRDLSMLASDAADVPERHRSLRATFDASWRLLTDAERSAAAALSVFRSGFDRTAAMSVAGADLPLLRLLLDKSLLTRHAGRFVMLDMVRQYARERLAEDGAAERHALSQHAEHVAGLLAARERGVLRSEQDALNEVAAAIDEVRAAWTHAVACTDVPMLMRMVDCLFHFYDARGWVREGVDVFEQALDTLGGTSVAGDAAARSLAALRGRLEVRCGALWNRMGELDRAEYLLGRGTLAADAAGDTRELAFGLQKLGANLLAAGAHDDAEQAQRRALELSRETGSLHAIGWSLNHLGNVMIARSEYDEAARLFTDALAALRQDGDRNGVWVTSNNLGVIAANRKNYAEAARRFSEALAQQADQDNRRSAAMLLNNLGAAVRAMGDDEAAALHLGKALAISRQMGYQGIAALAQTGLAEIDLNRGDHAAADAALRTALHTALSARNQPVALQALATGARLRQRQGDDAAAKHVARAVAAHPASGEEARAAAVELLHELGVAASAASTDEVPDLDGVVAAFTGGSASDYGSIPVTAAR